MTNTEMRETNIMLIPANNEGNYKRNQFEHLRLTIQEIRRAGFTGKIVVVNDGSLDNTAQIAREEGAEVINFRKRRGKASAIFFGLAKVARLNPTCVITMDADLIESHLKQLGYSYKEDIKKLVTVANNATREGRILQGIARVCEFSKPWPLEKKSGIRCFSSKAVAEIVKTKKSSVKEFQLEEFLNRLFTHHTVRVNTNLIFNVPWRSSTAKRFQGRKSTARIPKNVKIRVIPRHR